MPVDPQMQAVIERVAKSVLPPFHTVSAEEARRLCRGTRSVLGALLKMHRMCCALLQLRGGVDQVPDKVAISGTQQRTAV